MNVEKDNNFVYIENYVALKAYLDSSEVLSKYRTKLTSGNYYVNGLFSTKVGNVYIINFLPNYESKLERKQYNLSIESERKLFKILFKEVLNPNEIVPYFVKFSEKENDNILVNLKVKSYLMKAVFEAENSIKEV